MNDYYDDYHHPYEDQESFDADNEQKGEGMEILKKRVVVHERGEQKKLVETIFDADFRYEDLGLEGIVNADQAHGITGSNALYEIDCVLGAEHKGKGYTQTYEVEALRLQLSDRSLTALLMLLPKMQKYAHSNLPQTDDELAQDDSADVRARNFSGARFHVSPETLDATVHPGHIDRKARQSLAQMVLEGESKLTDDEKKMSADLQSSQRSRLQQNHPNETAKMAGEVRGVAAHAYAYIEDNYPKGHPLEGGMSTDETAEMVERLYALAERYGEDTSDDPGSPYYNSNRNPNSLG